MPVREVRAVQSLGPAWGVCPQNRQVRKVKRGEERGGERRRKRKVRGRRRERESVIIDLLGTLKSCVLISFLFPFKVLI